jgi:aryl-alcohol dehydrogenase-like predicted oxidoreductase
VGSAPEFFGRGLTEDQAFELMDAAWESGLAWFDTADAYGGGRSEQAIGRWIASRGVRPRLTTKTFNPMGSGAEHGLKPERIARQLRSSLERLGVDHVELYLAHDYDPDVPLAEALAAFQAAQDDGLIGGYGVSNFNARQLEAALALAWLLDGDRVAQIVIGPGRPEHLAPVAEALEHPLTGDERTAVESAVSGLGPGPGADTEAEA